jgi:hypothetical protein
MDRVLLCLAAVRAFIGGLSNLEGVNTMTRDIRWRILSLQIVAILVLGFCAGVGYWAHNFTHDQVTAQLSEQQIVFPPISSAAIKALPAADASAMSQYAGQTMTTGDQAHVWANSFIAVHLKGIGAGKTYDYYSGKAIAETKTNPKQSAIDNGIALTLFRGETLRSLLLQAWAFWFAGTLAFYAAIGLTVGAGAVFLAFLFELLMVPRRERASEAAGRKVSPVATPA